MGVSGARISAEQESREGVDLAEKVLALRNRPSLVPLPPQARQEMLTAADLSFSGSCNGGWGGKTVHGWKQRKLVII